ncbi:hypothetical protein [Paraburkholderia sp. HD33-4]|uniref:hypothetical protein n=1 Tax=Paraburkholderia sp. HD33-4 TaxID=2883242 RepID=UPI001F3930F8|nr:hypothetical protein [Paraburkholderia sp. HD33-4]
MAAFITWIAAPGNAMGVKSPWTPPATTSFEATPAAPALTPAPAAGGDTANPIVPDRRDGGSIG